ncbi:MAG TPA: exodeoxyribonuclease VII large subunit [Bacteroidota bacterium]|nr:exodeoxyribonuclease VII large subunit [Bacteroidota bacterium]
MKVNQSVLTVSELTRRVKSTLEVNFSDVSVQGEISNFKRHSSGHLYFTLKDENAQISAVMWRGRAMNLFFTPQDGMKVIARGKLTVYEIRGVYQIDVAQIQPLGIGELQLAFERLKQKLSEEGLFDAEYKLPLPAYPERIGIVTSPTGAAIQDIINIISRRFPAVELILYPVRVQGVGSASEIASAIRDFNTYGKIDVMIVGRGGGSLEDLWAFNEEIVARAIFDSKIPIISAVGHEVDYTIADFVADMRAPTPSAAAEMAVPDQSEVVEILRNFYYTSEQIVGEKLTFEKQQINALLQSYSFHRPHDLIHQHSQRLDELQHTLGRSVRQHFTIIQQRIDSFQKRLLSVNPKVILERGYAIVSRDGKIISRAGELHKNESIEMTFHDGDVPAIVQ